MASKGKTLDNSGFSLASSIDTIVQYKNPFKNYTYEFTLHTSAMDYKLETIVSYERMRDYANNVGDYIILTAKIFLGDYAKLIYPERDFLMCSVVKQYTLTIPQEEEQFKAVIINDNGTIENVGAIQSMSMSDLNKDGQKEVEFQLYPLEIEAFKNTLLSGVYQESTVANIMYGLFAETAKKIKLNGKPLDFSIEMRKPSNQMEYDNIVLSTGLPLVNLPSYLQNTNYGVYNGDCGTYYQKYGKKNVLWIYPLYSKTLFDEDSKLRKLIIYKASNVTYDAADNTFTIANSNLELLASTKAKTTEKASNNIIDRGDSIVTPNNAVLLNREMEVTDDEIIYDKDKYIVGTTTTYRSDGLTKPRFVASTPNMHYVRSAILREQMMYVQVPWHFSNDIMVYPGMPVQYITDDAIYGVRRQNGTLLGIFTRYDAALKTTSSMLTIAVQSHLAYDPIDKE